MPVLESILAAGGVGLAAGSSTTSIASYLENKKARKARETTSKNLPNGGTAPMTTLWQQGGQSEIHIGANGSIMAVGRGPGDYSMGFVQTGESKSQATAAQTSA